VRIVVVVLGHITIASWDCFVYDLQVWSPVELGAHDAVRNLDIWRRRNDVHVEVGMQAVKTSNSTHEIEFKNRKSWLSPDDFSVVGKS
jgi:hypothetical protein